MSPVRIRHTQFPSHRKNDMLEFVLDVVMNVEALGSWHEALATGAIGTTGPAKYLNEVRELMVPESRGGLAKGLQAELDWEGLVEKVRTIRGPECFAAIRAKLGATGKHGRSEDTCDRK